MNAVEKEDDRVIPLAYAMPTVVRDDRHSSLERLDGCLAVGAVTMVFLFVIVAIIGWAVSG